MSTFAVMVFPSEEKALEGLLALQELHAEGALTVHGTDLLKRDDDGRISVLKRDDKGPIRTGVGTLAGALVGLFGGPVGAAVGAAVGGTAGAVGDVVRVGVSDAFLTAVEQDLEPGKLAIIAELSEEWLAPLDTRMEKLGAKVVRQDRLGFEEALLQRRVSARKAHLAQLKAERAGAKAQAAMEKLLTDDVEYARRTLEYVAHRYDEQLVGVRQDLDAKIGALLAQAAGAKPEVRDEIERRMAALRDEFAKREKKLARAMELTREALENP